MKWVRTKSGERAHAVLDGRLLCMQVEAAGFDEVVGTVDFEDRCRNCDNRWREAGRATRPKARTPQTKPGTTYRPRHTIRDWER